MYFSAFPYIVYDSVGDYNFKVTTNLLRRVALRAKVKQNTLVFDTYDLREGETPEIIAHKLYGDPTLHWIVLMSNDISDRYHQWPMKAGQFNQYLIDKYGLAGIDSIHHYELNQLSGDTTVKIDIGTSNTDYSPVSKSFNLATAIEKDETHIKVTGAEEGEDNGTGLNPVGYVHPVTGFAGWQFEVGDELLYTNLTGTTEIAGQIPELQFNNSYFVVDQAVDLVLDGVDIGFGRFELEQTSGVMNEPIRLEEGTNPDSVYHTDDTTHSHYDSGFLILDGTDSSSSHAGDHIIGEDDTSSVGDNIISEAELTGQKIDFNTFTVGHTNGDLELGSRQQNLDDTGFPYDVLLIAVGRTDIAAGDNSLTTSNPAYIELLRWADFDQSGSITSADALVALKITQNTEGFSIFNYGNQTGLTATQKAHILKYESDIYHHLVTYEQLTGRLEHVGQILLEVGTTLPFSSGAVAGTNLDIMTSGDMHILLDGTDADGANSGEKIVSEHTNNYIQISEQKGGGPIALSPDDAGNTGVHHFAKVTNSVSDTAVRVVTNREFEQDRQDSLRRIRLLKPEYIPQVVEEFQELMNESII